MEVEFETDFKIVVTPSDTARLNFITKSFGLDAETPSRVFHDVLCRNPLPSLTDRFEEDFAVKIARSCLANSDPISLETRVPAVVSRIFSTLSDANFRIGREELLACLALISSGSKSKKLSVMFRLYDRDCSSMLSRSQLMQFMRTIMLSVACLTDSAQGYSREALQRAATRRSGAIAKDICKTNTHCSFDDLSAWYNNGGYLSCAWIELIDDKKWPEVEGKQETRRESPVKRKTDSTSSSPPSTTDSVVFSFDFGGFVLNMTKGQMTKLCHLAKAANLISLDCRTAVDAIYVLADTAHSGADAMLMISKTQYDKCIRKLIPGKGLTADEKEEFSQLLSQVFFAFDRSDTGTIDALELSCGFCMLCGGSKSEKLSFAFDLMDEDGDGLLSRRGLWRYLRSFINVLLVLSGRAASMSTDELSQACDNCAVWTSSHIMSSLPAASDGQRTRHVSFDDIADWYTKGGFKACPWLELLDVKKWFVGK